MKKIFLILAVVLFCFSAQSTWAQSQLPDIKVKNMDGYSVSAQTFSNGDNPFIVVFWATWAAPSRFLLDEMTKINPGWKEKKNLKIYAISTEKEASKIKNYISREGWDYVFMYDGDELLKAVWEEGESESTKIPYTLFFGGIAHQAPLRKVGNMDKKMIDGHISTSYTDWNEYWAGLEDFFGTSTPSGVTNNTGVTINGITWASYNVGKAGKFVDKPEDCGNYYNFNEAQTVCPEGWRTPSVAELASLTGVASVWTTEGGVKGRRYGSGNNTIFLPAAGRKTRSGSMFLQDSYGQYWSNTQAPRGSNSDGSLSGRALSFHDSGGSPDIINSAIEGMSVRCVKADTPKSAAEKQSKMNALGVQIAGITWSTSNVGEPGTFVSKPEYLGNYYDFYEALTACPAGWRVPTNDELARLARTNNFSTVQNGVEGQRFGSGDNTIFLPSAGFKTDPSTIKRSFYGSDDMLVGLYWSCNTLNNGSEGNALCFWGPSPQANYSRNFTTSLSVRCVKDDSLMSDPPSDISGVTINGITWASRNVGRSETFVSKPEDRGNYFTWDEAQTVCPDGWRLPTIDELDILAFPFDQHMVYPGGVWRSVNGIKGCQFGVGDKAIFMPATGFHNSTNEGKLQDDGIIGYYWSSSHHGDKDLRGVLIFDEGYDYTEYPYDRRDKLPVRCVKK